MAASSILLPNGDYLPSQSFAQDGHTTKAQELVICDASGNIVGVTSNRLDVNVGAALPAGTNNIGDVDVATLGQGTAVTDSFTGGLQTKALTSVVGYSSVTVLISGTYGAATFAMNGYNDGTGTTGVAIPFRNLASGSIHTLFATAANATLIFQADVSGLTHISMGSGNFASGTANIRVQASASPAVTTTASPASRTYVSYYAVAAAAGTTTTETAITLTKSFGTAGTSTGASQTPGAGRRFRIQAIMLGARGHATATIQSTTFNVRLNTGGAVGTTSTPVIFSARCATAAVASDWDRVILPIPDGYEIQGDGTLQFGVTAAATYTTNAPTWDVNILGYEY